MIFLFTSSRYLSFVYGDADFRDVGTDSNRDWSRRTGDPEHKYFYDPGFDLHYDGWFASHTLPEEEKLPHLIKLMRTFLSTTMDIGPETWILHGTLLGWWWNQKILLWDSDLDVQVSERTTHLLAKYYYMTEHHFDFLASVEGGHMFLKLTLVTTSEGQTKSST